jgi:4-amino-4-deoxy-L-arabinose transferase-like glycosyltransferase
MSKVKNKWFGLLAILILAFLLRLGYLIIFGGFDNTFYDSSSDQLLFIDIARNIAAGNGFMVSEPTWTADAGKATSIVPPLYPLFLAFWFNFFGENFAIIRFVQVLLSLIVVMVTYLIADRVFGQKIALIAGLSAALYPTFIMYTRPLLSETLFFPIFTLFGLATLYLHFEKPPLWLYIVWGISGGLSYLTKSEVGLAIAFTFCYLAIRHWYLSKKFKSALIYLLPGIVLGLVLLPYSVYNTKVHGNIMPVPTQKWAFWASTWLTEARESPEWANVILPERKLLTDWAELTEIQRDNKLWSMGVQFVIENPLTYLKQRPKYILWSYPLIPLEWGRKELPDGHKFSPTSLDDRVRYVTVPELIRLWLFRLIFVLAVGGIILAFKRKQPYIFWMLIIVFTNAMLAVIFNGAERIRLQVDVYLILFASSCALYLAVRLQKWLNHRKAVKTVLVQSSSGT